MDVWSGRRKHIISLVAISSVGMRQHTHNLTRRLFVGYQFHTSGFNCPIVPEWQVGQLYVSAISISYIRFEGPVVAKYMWTGIFWRPVHFFVRARQHPSHLKWTCKTCWRYSTHTHTDTNTYRQSSILQANKTRYTTALPPPPPPPPHIGLAPSNSDAMMFNYSVDYLAMPLTDRSSRPMRENVFPGFTARTCVWRTTRTTKLAHMGALSEFIKDIGRPKKTHNN